MSLRELPLKVTYRSGETDILNDFYIPCLERSVLYKRAVGFFTSGTLAEAARGVVGLVKNGGKMLIVACPKLTEEDAKGIAEGYEKRKIIESRLLDSLTNPLDEADIQRVKNLVWMITNGVLDIKIAIPVTESQGGIYHEKVGIFYDSRNIEKSNLVVFSGSLNETSAGLVSNYESIDVYVSWDSSDREKERITGHVRHFDDIWNNRAPGIETFEFPEALKRRLIDFYHPEELESEPGRRRRPFPFQKEAVIKWKENAETGILAMATGTGKTFTALKCIEEVPDEVLIVVAVPQEALIEQWVGEIQSEFQRPRIIQVSSDHDWRPQLDHLILAIEHDATKGRRNFVVGTLQSMHKPTFRERLERLGPGRVMMVVDEVHHVGAPSYRSLLECKAKYKLGLSATPERAWDDEGNQAIFDYFGPEIFTYEIEDAVKDGVLTPYNYHIHVTSLTPQERISFKEISARISTLMSKILQTYPELSHNSAPNVVRYLDALSPRLANSLRTLYLKRVDIAKRAQNKSQILREIVSGNMLRRCLVYCADLSHLNACARILHEQGLVAQEYSSAISTSLRTKILSSFAQEYSQTRFLLSVRCLDEGIDLPAVDSAILVSSSRSTREFIQRRGRILRRHPTKKVSTIHDIVILPTDNVRELLESNDAERQFVEVELSRVRKFSETAINAHAPEIRAFWAKFGRFASKD